jgi:hypothetical protein
MEIVELTPKYQERTFEEVNCFDNISYYNMKYLCGDQVEKFNLFVNTKRVKQSCDQMPESDILIIDTRPRFFNFKLKDLDFNIFKQKRPKQVIINLASEGGIGGFYKNNIQKALNAYADYFETPTKMVTQNQLVTNETKGLYYHNICLSRNYFLNKIHPCSAPTEKKAFIFNYICGTLIGGDGIREDKVKVINILNESGFVNNKLAVSSSLFKKSSLRNVPRLKSLKKNIKQLFSEEKLYNYFEFRRPEVRGRSLDDKLGHNPIRINGSYYYNSYMSVIQETECSQYTNRFTEKTIKAIAVKHPFIIIGNKGALSLLKSHGFKTFEGFIDESYDEQNDLESKMSIIIKEMNKFSKFSHKQWLDFYKETENIRNYNYKLFYGRNFQEYLLQNKYEILQSKDCVLPS